MDKLDRGTIVTDRAEADAFGWIAETPKSTLKEVGFKHPKLGTNDVCIDITYTGVCQSDVGIINHAYGDAMGPFAPCICGHEIVGRIRSVGNSVGSKFKVGDLVGVGPQRDCCGKCEYCLAGFENHCENIVMKMTLFPFFGGFATQIQLPSNYVIKIPDGMDEKLCPSLFCAGGTVFAPLKRYGGKGKKCAIIGIGGLGHLAIMMASAMGMKVYAVSTSDSKKEYATQIGANVFVNSKNPDELKKFQGEKIDLILNTSLSEELWQYVLALKKGTGVFVSVGAPHSMKTDINSVFLVMNSYTIAGSCTASIEELKAMLIFCKENKIYPKCEFYSWENFNDAVEKCGAGKANFRSVIDVTTFKK